MNLEGIARPYAKAIFEVAQENNQLDAIAQYIEISVSLVSTKEFQQIINSPDVQKEDLLKIILDVTKNKSSEYFVSFIKLLIENNRLLILPALYRQFIHAIALKSNVRRAEVIVAQKIKDAQISGIQTALEKRYNCKIKLQVKVDSSVLGGTIIKMDDDTVFDGSLAIRLDKLGYLLSN